MIENPRGEAILLAAVLAGGAVGSAARYLAGRAAAHLAAAAVEAFPWHTFVVNVLGSFVLGLVAGWYKGHPQPGWYVLLGTGFCGGFTTFSTFSLEALGMLEKGRTGAAAAYVAGSVAAGLGGALVGLRIARGG